MTFKLNASLCPALASLIKEGKIFFDKEDNEYVGITLEGNEVGIGEDPNQIEKWLVDYPEPSNW